MGNKSINLFLFRRRGEDGKGRKDKREGKEGG
jgi:hypothetical protein